MSQLPEGGGRTRGSPHGGRWYIGLLFHCGGTSLIVRFASMLDDGFSRSSRCMYTLETQKQV